MRHRGIVKSSRQQPARRHLRATAPNLGSMARAIEDWFRGAGRDLPWRRPGARSGYAGLVSESMAQQTQMSRVAIAFERFMARFPTIETLASAPEQEVLAAWSGLGYYGRARNLHAAAKVVVTEHGGEVPAEIALLRALPGVGRYTAGAIASIVYGRPEPIVDGNVARVLMRVRGRAGTADEPATIRWLWAESQRLVEAASDPRACNEGVMELGAVLCTPRSPRCTECPLSARCAARSSGTAERIPVPKRRPVRAILHQHVIVLRRGGSILVEQRPAQGLWAGMWQAPTIESDAPLNHAHLLDRLSPAVSSLREIGAFVHLTTHREVRVRVFVARTSSTKGRWVDAASQLDVPMGAAARRAIGIALADRSRGEQRTTKGAREAAARPTQPALAATRATLVPGSLRVEAPG